jgi:hypothetical protein
MVLCRHANREQEAFPSKKLISGKLGISERTVFDAIKQLTKYNVISVSGQERKDDGSFKVKMYILNDKSEWIYPQATVAVGKKRHSPQANNDITRRQPLPNKDTHIKDTHIKDIYTPEFKTFWKAYPRGEEKKQAFDEWKKLNPDNDLQKFILQKLEEYKKTKTVKDGYAIYAVRWLKRKRWEDEPTELTPEQDAIRMAKEAEIKFGDREQGVFPFDKKYGNGACLKYKKIFGL